MTKAAVTVASFVLALLVTSCASTGKTNKIEGRRYTIPENLKKIGMEVVTNGDTCTISFDANSTTGYAWEYSLDKDGVIRESTNYYVENEHKEGMVGYGGRQYYIFKAVKTGTTTATFIYRRPWEGGEQAYVATVYFEVDADKNIYVANIH